MAFDIFNLANNRRPRGQTLADVIGALGQGVGGATQGYMQGRQYADQQAGNAAAAEFMGGGQAQGAAPLTGQVAGMNAPGAGGSTGAGGGAAFPQDKSAIIDQLRQYAGAAKLDPTQTNQYIASALAESSGEPGAVGDAKSSFGLHQGHVGGLAGGGNAKPGLGDTFMQQTGMTLDQFKSPQGQQAFEQWVAQNWSKYGNPDIFHAMRTPAYQHALASLQGGGGTTPSAAPQPGAAQPQGQPQQGGMDRVRSEFQRFQQSSGLPPGQAWQAFSQHVMPVYQKEEALNQKEQALALREQQLSQMLQIAQLKDQGATTRTGMQVAGRHEDVATRDQGATTRTGMQVAERAREFDEKAQEWKEKQATLATEKNEKKRAAGYKDLIADKQKFVNTQKALLGDYERAAGNPYSDKKQLAETFGDPRQIAQSIKKIEQEIEALRKEQQAPTQPEPRSAGPTSPAKQPPAQPKTLRYNPATGEIE